MTPWETADSSFSIKRVNDSTFVVKQDDSFLELPLIYVKLHPRIPAIILSDTGSDYPSERSKKARFTRLGDFLENCPVKVNDGKPLNPGGARKYIIICTHCHYDHVGGITQFLDRKDTEIIALAAGRNFIESDLGEHGEFRHVGQTVPHYVVTGWAEAFDKLYYDVHKKSTQLSSAGTYHGLVDLGVTFIQTPGHTPDELAWYDHDERHLYVGDSLYEEGEEGMAIIWPIEGNLVEWAFSMQKLRNFVRAENNRSMNVVNGDDYIEVPFRVRLGAGHQTYSTDAEEVLGRLERFWRRVLRNEVPVVGKKVSRGHLCYTWRDEGGDTSTMSFQAPARLMDEARRLLTDPSMT